MIQLKSFLKIVLKSFQISFLYVACECVDVAGYLMWGPVCNAYICDSEALYDVTELIGVPKAEEVINII